MGLIRLYDNQQGGISTQSKLIRLYSDRPQPQPEILKPPEQNLLDKSIGFAQQTFPQTNQLVKDFNVDPLSLKANPKKALTDIWDSVKHTVEGSRDSFSKLFTPEYQNESIAGKIGLSAKALSSATNLAFTPITTLFTAANDIPVLGSIAKLISMPFSVAGESGSNVAGKLVDKLPISQESKNKLKPGIQEIGSLAGQIALGGAIDLGVKKIELVKRFGEQDAQTIIDKAQEIAKPQESQPELPPVKIYKNAEQVAKELGVNQEPTQPQKIKLYPETKVAKAASDINIEIVKKGFDELPFEEQARFNPITKADQELRVAELLDKDIKKAQDMALGREPLPTDVHPQVVFNAVKKKALEDQDIGMLKDLASSPIATERSIAAQTLSAAGFDNSFDPVRVMQDLMKSRQQKFEKTNRGQDISKIKKVDTENIKQEIKKNSPTKETWDGFIDSLIC